MTMDTTPHCYAEYFDNPSLSDVKFRIGASDIYAHRIILANSSPYFKALFEGSFREGREAYIELKYGNPAAVRDVIAYLYGRVAYSSPTVSTSASGADITKRAIDVYAAAQYYAVPALRSEICGEFQFMVEAVLGEQGEIYSDNIDEVIRHVYQTDDAAELRRPLLAVVTKYVSTWQDFGTFKRMLEDTPDLAFDLVVALADAKVSTPPKRGAAASAGKRKKSRQSSDDTLDTEIAVFSPL